MSRPFSYNDENFTVIGNILLFHINVTKTFEANSNIVEIPPVLYYHINQHTLMGNMVRPLTASSVNNGFTLAFYITSENGKYYLRSANGVPSFYIISAYVHLKDI